ncbi:DNA-binding transcriptional regulator [uncultured Aeromicrobium sp.]|uniref:helix-turn-helix domain-containing protein n=1 Tax=uncultured Aeromicrobium sp. TaxID=337820 RepID=UPI0025DBE994|nr:DUF1870 family protein [uncultured Aeromicrobium sp.]
MDDDPMTSAELRIARERMGLSAEWLAEYLGVALRTVRRWEHGHSPISDGVAREVIELVDEFDEFVDGIVQTLEADPSRDDAGREWLVTYGSDELYRREQPDAERPAGWHRAAMGEVARRSSVPVRIRFLEPGESDE